MTDGNDHLEAELSAMRPRAPDATLMGRIESGMNDAAQSRWADRFLWCAIGSGALAACVIVGVLTIGDRTSPMADPQIASIAQAPLVTTSGYSLASADHEWSMSRGERFPR